jgi:hypothetical protein
MIQCWKVDLGGYGGRSGMRMLDWVEYEIREDYHTLSKKRLQERQSTCLTNHPILALDVDIAHQHLGLVVCVHSVERTSNHILCSLHYVSKCYPCSVEKTFSGGSDLGDSKECKGEMFLQQLRLAGDLGESKGGKEMLLKHGLEKREQRVGGKPAEGPKPISPRPLDSRQDVLDSQHLLE